MKKNVFDKLNDSYESFHLNESEINVGNNSIYISPRLKLILAWSIFVLCCVLAYIFLFDTKPKTEVSQEEKEAILEEKVDSDEEHDTIIPYQKDVNDELNKFINKYLRAITDCDNETLQEMVTNSSEYNSAEGLKKKAEFITNYDNITVYTKEGLDEGSYIAFVVANVTIAGVNSSPYDIITLYVVDGARGYIVNNGKISKDATDYIEKVKGDKDIQKIYKSVEKKNKELENKDDTLKEFYDIIRRGNVETNSAADELEKSSQEEEMKDTKKEKKKQKNKKKKNKKNNTEAN